MTTLTPEQEVESFDALLSLFQNACIEYGEAKANGRGMHKAQAKWARDRVSLTERFAQALAAQNPPLGHLIDDKGITRRIGGVEVYDDRVMFTCRREPGETFTLWGDAALAATPNAKGTK